MVRTFTMSRAFMVATALGVVGLSACESTGRAGTLVDTSVVATTVAPTTAAPSTTVPPLSITCPDHIPTVANAQPPAISVTFVAIGHGSDSVILRRGGAVWTSRMGQSVQVRLMNSSGQQIGTTVTVQC